MSSIALGTHGPGVAASALFAISSSSDSGMGVMASLPLLRWRPGPGRADTSRDP